MTESRILVVDDERIVSLDIQGALARLGYVLAGSAATGEEALALAQSAKPDLVLMDIRLEGGMDGTEAAVLISQAVDVPVVFLTAHSDEQTMRRALAVSPFGYLIKPFEDRELRSGIELALAKHAAERDLRRARRAAEQADQAKTAFLGALSHELRTPMNGILGMSELLLLSRLDDEQRETVELLQRCAQSMTELLNQLLDFSALEAGLCALPTQEFSLAEFLDEATAKARTQAQAKGLAFELTAQGLPERAVGSPRRMRQALEQLLNNAVAFTESGAVRLVAGIEAQSGQREGGFVLLLRVADTGPGIAPEFLPSIFNSFTQGEDLLTRRGKGLGLGLAMCRRLAECLGGRLGVESRLGQGSEFCLRLPLHHVFDAGCGPGLLSGVRVLLVQGSGSGGAPLVQALELAGGSVRQASAGGQVKAALAEAPVEAVVFAPSLEIQDALPLTRMVRAGLTRVPCAAPILGVFPLAAPTDRERCLFAGMDAVLAEPPDSLRCIDSLSELLSRGKACQNTTNDRQGADAP